VASLYEEGCRSGTSLRGRAIVCTPSFTLLYIIRYKNLNIILGLFRVYGSHGVSELL
jgi:hypothetical protein